MTVFGLVITGGEVEQAALTTLKAAFPTYLHELERQKGYAQDALPNPKSYAVVSGRAPTNWPDEQLPAVVVMSPGTTGQPRRSGEGFISARWEVAVGIVTAAKNAETARKLSHVYAAVAMLILPQRLPQPGTVVAGCDFQGVEYLALDTEEPRALDAASLGFVVLVDDVMNTEGGPLVLDPAPSPTSPEWPHVTDVDLDVQKIPN